MMKRSITVFIFALFALFAFSQTVNIKYKDGRTDRYKLGDIEFLYFQGNNNQGGDDSPQGNNEDEAERIGNDKYYGLLTLTIDGDPWYVWSDSTIRQRKKNEMMSLYMIVSQKGVQFSSHILHIYISPTRVSQIKEGDVLYKDDILIYSFRPQNSATYYTYNSLVDSGSISFKRIGESDLTIQFNDFKFRNKISGLERIVNGTAKLVHSLNDKNGNPLPFSYVD